MPVFSVYLTLAIFVLGRKYLQKQIETFLDYLKLFMGIYAIMYLLTLTIKYFGNW